MTSEDPGMSVSAPATRPPVQDSAVATVSLRIRHRSSSERERARASLPLMSVAPTFVCPRKTNGGARGRSDAFLAAGKAESLAGGRLDGDAGDVDARDLGNARAHGVTQRADLRPFADQRNLEVGDPAAARGDALDGVGEKFVGRGALPLHVAGWKVRADVAVRQRAEDGVDQRMQSDIAVGMGEKAACVRDADAADHQVIAVAEGVHVIAGAGPDVAELAGEAGFLADEIFR